MPRACRTRRRYLFAVAALAIAHPAFAAFGTLTIAWDPSPDPHVAGYHVFVRTGQSTRVFDVGMKTHLVFEEAVEGQRYHFSVAAYTPERRLGPRSAEISGMTGPPLMSRGPSAHDPPPGSHSAGPASARPNLCVAAGSPHCRARSVAAGLGAVSSLATLPDGRLVFIEGASAVRVIARGTLLRDAALRAETAGTSLVQLAVDPAFAQSGIVLVAEIARSSRDGRRELGIRRYRMLGNVLGEGAHIVSGIPISDSGEPHLALDTRGRLYVAMPREPDRRRGYGPYDGLILRFNVDGSVPRENRAGSPIVAIGYARPTGLAWDPGGQRLWLSGIDRSQPSSLSSLESTAESPEWPRRLRSVREGAQNGSRLPASIDAMTIISTFGADAPATMFVLGSGRLFRVEIARSGEVRSSPVPIPIALPGSPSAMAAAPKRLHVAISADSGGPTPTSDVIVDLTPDSADPLPTGTPR